jgi:hypothetical protein
VVTVMSVVIGRTATQPAATFSLAGREPKSDARCRTSSAPAVAGDRQAPMMRPPPVRSCHGS